MTPYLILPFFLQALVILIDELYFHVRRGLPKWERIGHPMDTFTVILCMFYVLLVPFSAESLKIYCFLAVFSCLMVTKDEFIHKHFCPASENYLHAFLFILHPITLACTALIWPMIWGYTLPEFLSPFISNSPLFIPFLWTQGILMSCFFTYQIVFWNFIWNKKTILQD